jgi:hypothetical protein
MRGFAGFALDVLLPGLFAVCFGSGMLAMIRRFRRDLASRQERRRSSILSESASVVWTILGISVFVLVLLVMPLTVAYANMRIHYDLWELRPLDVHEIQVGARHFTDSASISTIVAALKSSEWYSVNHGGWGDETPIIVKFESGTQWHMRAGYHFTQHGAVVLRSSAPHGSGWALGQVFSTTLPQILEQLGVPLSRCDTAHGYPCKAGVSAMQK